MEALPQRPETIHPDYWEELVQLDAAYRQTYAVKTQPEPARQVLKPPFQPQPVIYAPNVAGAKNFCGQAAAASIIQAWGLNISGNIEALITDMYLRYPPNVLWGEFGTDTGRLVEMLKAYGLKNTFSLSVFPWGVGGFANPGNQLVWHTHRIMIESQFINKGIPVITLVDSGKVGGSWFNLHWIIYYKEAQGRSWLCNLIDKDTAVENGTGYSFGSINNAVFHQAWECSFIPLPGFRFVTVIPLP